MALEIRTSPQGLSALWDGKLLTSAYQPMREAQAWAARVPASPGSLVFVAGDPWGLAAQALAARGVRAVALVPGPQALEHLPPGVEAWSPGGQPLEDFLHSVFDSTGPDAVHWEVWPGFERLASGLALEWSRRFRDLYRTVQGSWLTSRRFGPRLWRNALRNFLDWERPGQLEAGNRPLIIAASGPSLDDGLEMLARDRNRFDLWALPSSFETLVRRGLSPDAGVATDGGFYAREHLHRLDGTRVPVLAALSSAPDPVLTRRPCLFFGQGLSIERALLQTLALPFPEVPSQGTVAVTALRMALEATSGPVLIAGLDLAFRDLRGHTSPHTVDRRLEALHHRLNPGEHQWAARLFEQATVIEDGTRTSPALLTYALWFRSRARFSRPVFRIAPSALRWNSMTEISWDQAAALWNQTGGRPGQWTVPASWPSRSQRIQAADQCLEALGRRAAQAVPDDPWLVETGRTAVPEALAEDFQARRRGQPGSAVQRALPEFLAGLRRGLA